MRQLVRSAALAAAVGVTLAAFAGQSSASSAKGPAPQPRKAAAARALPAGYQLVTSGEQPVTGGTQGSAEATCPSGTIAISDLRMMGLIFKKESASDVFHQLIPWITAGFLMMIVTGMLLLWSEPVKCYNSIWFRLKVLFLFLAGLNVLIFHSSKIYRHMHEWEWSENPPRAAKIAGWISLISWGIVIIAGRTTAYNF